MRDQFYSRERILIKLLEFQKSIILEMADLAVANGTDPTEVEEIAAKVGLFPCAGCKERGNYPSVYLREKEEFTNGLMDTFLNGQVCNECVRTGNDFSY